MSPTGQVRASFLLAWQIFKEQSKEWLHVPAAWGLAYVVVIPLCHKPLPSPPPPKPTLKAGGLSPPDASYQALGL